MNSELSRKRPRRRGSSRKRGGREGEEYPEIRAK